MPRSSSWAVSRQRSSEQRPSRDRTAEDLRSLVEVPGKRIIMLGWSSESYGSHYVTQRPAAGYRGDRR